MSSFPIIRWPFWIIYYFRIAAVAASKEGDMHRRSAQAAVGRSGHLITQFIMRN